MIEIILQGIKDNWLIVGLSLFMLVAGTIAAYRKFGLKRVLLGKKNDDRELVYRRQDNSIIWKDTLKTWSIILTGGMGFFTVFLIIMILILSFVYAVDMNATRSNDELLCQAFGTTEPTPEQVEEYYAENGIISERLDREYKEKYKNLNLDNESILKDLKKR